MNKLSLTGADFKRLSIAEAENLIARQSAIMGRKCGSCSLGCLLLDVPETNKPKDDWCPHCRPGRGGCAIYDQRPAVCRGYACEWMVNPTISDYWTPLRSKMVMDFHQETGAFPTLRVHVHPRYPNRWREQPYYDDLKGWLKGPDHYQTVISIRHVWTHIVLPHKAVPFTPGVTLLVGDDHWEHIATKSDADAKKLRDKLTAFSAAVDAVRCANPSISQSELLVRAAEMLARDGKGGQ